MITNNLKIFNHIVDSCDSKSSPSLFKFIEAWLAPPIEVLGPGVNLSLSNSRFSFFFFFSLITNTILITAMVMMTSGMAITKANHHGIPPLSSGMGSGLGPGGVG